MIRGKCLGVFAAGLAVGIGASAFGADNAQGMRKPVFAADVFGGYASNQITIQVKPGVVPKGLSLGNAAADAALTKWGVQKIDLAYPFPFGDPALAKQLGLDRYYTVRVPAKTDTPAMVKELAAFKTVLARAEIVGIGGTADTIPNDTDFAKCWGQHNTGQNSTCGGIGTNDADVDAPAAWDLWKGTDNITVAVIDSGVQKHTDFETSPGNSKVLTGWNTVSNNTNVTDDCQHGTHCAGTAAAVGNNSKGVAGMSWGAKILPVKVLTGCGGSTTDCAEGIIWAADNGAHVETMSLQYYTYDSFHENSCAYAWGKGVLVIAATGNGQGQNVAYPAKYAKCMGIGATTNKDTIANFSNWGPTVDVSAPGENVWSTVPTNSYNCYSGTSMATPHVAGLACLIWSYNKSLTNDKIEKILKETADDKGTPGFDNFFGFGRINAFNAIKAAKPCFADCDGSGTLDVDDFICMQTAFGLGDKAKADCDGNGTLDVDDFICFQTGFGVGCN